MKLLITGGAGFIGSALIRYIISQTNHSVVNVDKLTYAGNVESIDEARFSDRYTFYKTDICDMNSVEDIVNLEKPDSIIHLAAESHVDRSIDAPSDFITTNINGTYTLLEVARRYYSTLSNEKQTLFKFHHVSTDEVYGDLPHPDDVDDNSELPKFTELTSYHPSSPYSASKASSDLMVKAWNRTYGLPVVVSNCSNNYGPFHFPEKLIPLCIISALQGKALPIYGDGSQIRDWLFVEDHARALLLVVEKGRVGETYNVGGNNEVRNIDVVKTICSILDDLIPKETPYSQQIEYVKDRPGHDRRYAIDATKITNELGWQPSETFHSGIRKTVQWYLANESWWTRVLDGSYKLDRIGLGED